MESDLSPIFDDTERVDVRTWRPSSLERLRAEARGLALAANPGVEGRVVLYRGQSTSQWPINSTFARAATDRFNASDPWFGNQLHQAFIDKFTAVVRPSKELVELKVHEAIDEHFELMKRMQQHPEEFASQPCISGTNLVDWSLSLDVATTFASEHSDREGVVYVFDAVEAGTILVQKSVREILQLMQEQLNSGEIRGMPLLICPPRQIGYRRAERQQARYLAQTDLRHSVDHVWEVAEQARSGRHLYRKLLVPTHVKLEVAAEAEVSGRTRNWLLDAN